MVVGRGASRSEAWGPDVSFDGEDGLCGSEYKHFIGYTR